MKSFFTLLFLGLIINGYGQLLTWSPEFIAETSSNVEITVDATKGSQGLKDHTTTDVYVHIGVITNKSTNSGDWKYVPFTWGSSTAAAQATYSATNKWRYTITGNLRSFFNIVDPTEKILKIAIIFRSGTGGKKQVNTDGSDMYVPVYEAGLNARLNKPAKEPKYTPVAEPINVAAGSTLDVMGVSSESANLRVLINGFSQASVANSTVINTSVNTVSGDNQVILEASNANGTKYDTVNFFVNTPVVEADLPAGVNDGINYLPGNTSATLVLFAPNKTRVAVIGDFNSWTQTANYQMNRTPDGNRYWITLTGLTPGAEYGYQYLIDGTIKVADMYTEKVLDPFNDQYIPAANYPGLKPYPAGQSGMVSVLQTAKPAYTWQAPAFTRPDKRNLMIYELLVRDFVATQNWQSLRDTLSYIKRLGINTIEVMPFNEFEGNNSWGYNSDFYFAPDKMYGTETALKQFIDECHKQGIAVIMDIVLNHTYGPSPMALMYWDAANNRPASNNPWYNAVTPHTAINFGDDFNHESAATKDFFNRVVQHWITNYKVDGYRFDFTKGLTQKATNSDGAMSAYDAGRIAIINGYYNAIKAVDPNAYLILEHFAANDEETELSNNGMMLWANVWTQYQEASMGYLGNSNFGNGIHTSRSWSNPHLVTFMESHDEERITFKNIKYGNSSGSYNVKDTATALKRMELNSAFLLTIPGPKMIYEFGELGYDYSRCYLATNGEGGDCNTKTDPKPVRWDYQANPNRQAVYSVYSKLLNMRNVPELLPAFVTNNISHDLSGGFKILQVTSNALNITVIGNFDVVSASRSVTFQNAGVWYDYLTGGTRTATGGAENIILQPGEYHVYTSRDVAPLVAASLPLKLLSFTGRRTASNIDLSWSTANEVNVKNFEIERSLNGSDFTRIGIELAKNLQNSQTGYGFADNDQLALNAKGTLYYRLKMMDKDGAYTYTGVIAIKAVNSPSKITLYPNPVNGSQVFLNLDKTSSTVSIKVEDVTGRLHSRYTVNMSNYSNGIFPVNVSQLKNGAYLLKVEANDKTTVKQFIISR